MKIAVAVDDSPSSEFTSAAALALISGGHKHEEHEIHILAVKYIIPSGMATVPGLVTGDVTAVAGGYACGASEESARVSILLAGLRSKLSNNVESNIHLHALEPEGGASGVAESLVAWCQEKKPSILVMGSRQRDSITNAICGLVGLGSVSSYCLHNLNIPICVIPHSDKSILPEKKKVMVCMDETECSMYALTWTLDNILGEQNELHIVSVALPVPYDIVEEDSVASHVLTEAEARESRKNSIDRANDVIQNAQKVALDENIAAERLYGVSMKPEGGASDVASSLEHYAKSNNIDLVCMGKRSMGTLKRVLMSVVGLDSVSDWCVKHLQVPVIVIPKSNAS